MIVAASIKKVLPDCNQFKVMPLFQKQKSSLIKIKEQKIPTERELQNLTEENLDLIFDLEFVSSEFPINGLRIDTLAFNLETNSFAIIEYKKVKKFSVIDQGYAYLSQLVNNKADFILEYYEKLNKNLKRDQVSWEQSRVIFIAPKFTKYQKTAITLRDLPFELWEVKFYDNNSVLYNRLETPETAESFKQIAPKGSKVEKVTNEIKSYSEQGHVDYLPISLQEKYDELKEEIQNSFSNVEIKPLKRYIAFKSENNFISTVFRKNAIKVFINVPKGQLRDPQSLARDVSSIGHWGTGDYEITIDEKTKISRIWDLIEQAYNLNS
jgi:predicted transport protein